jgi:hypothetical protein
MTAKPKRDERGQFMPKWAAELRGAISQIQQLLWGLGGEIYALTLEQEKAGLIARLLKAEQVEQAQGELQSQINDLRDRLGTSTPLIILNIAMLIAIAVLGVAVAKLYGYASY